MWQVDILKTANPTDTNSYLEVKNIKNVFLSNGNNSSTIINGNIQAKVNHERQLRLSFLS